MRHTLCLCRSSVHNNSDFTMAVTGTRNMNNLGDSPGTHWCLTHLVRWDGVEGTPEVKFQAKIAPLLLPEMNQARRVRAWKTPPEWRRLTHRQERTGYTSNLKTTSRLFVQDSAMAGVKPLKTPWLSPTAFLPPAISRAKCRGVFPQGQT